MVSPMKGKPIEPGGSCPLHFGLYQLCSQRLIVLRSSKATMQINAPPHIGLAI
ncbi:hypothetical protein COLO4_17087 [Corchorus olitorius]|uniref:Uncharacterized protein n=1 Tax=Corchorus olitorius TaxID=93759 RepID=A0A1R3JE67_9ROSI|nr:hypothetical protein COLO4_17087 [Corchorus olitorius]